MEKILNEEKRTKHKISSVLERFDFDIKFFSYILDLLIILDDLIIEQESIIAVCKGYSSDEGNAESKLNYIPLFEVRRNNIHDKFNSFITVQDMIVSNLEESVKELKGNVGEGNNGKKV